MIRLGVNIDHVATVRQARGGSEPDPVWAAIQAELAGADSITFHLREDRRHLQTHDVHRLRETSQAPLNFELAVADEVIALALEIKPQMAMFVPENRQEITTEGGLDVCKQTKRLQAIIKQFKIQGIRTSAFIDADRTQIAAAAAVGFEVCEIHTGPYAILTEKYRRLNHPAVGAEINKIKTAGQEILNLGMQFNAGHGLNYRNVQPIAALPNVAELHIGHSIISRAIFTGIREAVREMKKLIAQTTATS